MIKLKNFLPIIFFVILICDTYSVATVNKPFEMLFKPLLMPILASWYLISVKKANFWFVSALFFSFWGDVLLLFEEKFFVFGLASFLVAHLLYIKLTATYIKNKIPVKKIITAIIPFLLFFAIIVFLTFPNLNEMLVPVLVYGLVIACFGAITLINYQQSKSTENFNLFLGAVIFIISDAIIALNVFYSYSLFNNVAIIVLYSLSQFLICKSVLNKQKQCALKKTE